MSCFEPPWPKIGRPFTSGPGSVRPQRRMGTANLVTAFNAYDPSDDLKTSGTSDVRLTLPARPENVAVVRHVLGAFAEALMLPDPVIEDMRLAVTEACTNVVRHAYADGEPGPVEILIHPVDDMLQVIVSDEGRGLGPSDDSSGPGLGLPLIAALAHSLEIEPAGHTGSRLRMSFLREPLETA
jgi:anti-sigma regulatory factor (Ser/Thr protein kinase)